MRIALVRCQSLYILYISGLSQAIDESWMCNLYACIACMHGYFIVTSHRNEHYRDYDDVF